MLIATYYVFERKHEEYSISSSTFKSDKINYKGLKKLIDSLHNL